ncbi:calcineurin-like phosphoesterase C-terminal domain-containing protein [Litoribacter populi]|uniref:calcineurin-like phosphoesterase C-terminal domain-containing protein n=1 Tax=Litoribacter populi TaxID=2598460 RepID=UPI00117DE037|nr:calcineurin-like phosphoesterase family protein [Litoribacter populi]
MFNRRSFLKTLGLSGVGISGLGWGTVNGAVAPYSALDFKAIRIRGKVSSQGTGLANVVVSDGKNVVATKKDGTYELISSNDREFVFASLPAGYQIPKLQNGSANYFHRLDKAKDEQEFHFKLEPTVQSDENHHFMLLADTQIQTDYEAEQLLTVAAVDVRHTVDRVGDPNMFGIGCGDLVFDKFELFKDYNQSVQAMGVPFFQVIGNHDMDLNVRTDKYSGQTFKSLFGPTYYSFNRGEIHYVVLDDVFYLGSDKNYIGYIDEDQLSWLEKDLAFVEKGKTVVVSLHIPTYTGAVTRYPDRNTLGGTVSNRQHLYRLLEGYEAHIMSGHTHFNDNMVMNDKLFEHCHGTVCGAWWSGPICYDGTPNGYGLYKAEGSRLSWKYKSTGKDLDHQMRISRNHPDFKEEISVNCWNWDPSWKVAWTEDGIQKGLLDRRVAVDPLSVELHKGPELPARRKWVEPQLSDHMFFFTPQNSNANIEVVAEDRFGNVFREKLV